MIYAIRAVGTSFIKIGYAKDSVQKRLKELQICCPLDLLVIASCEGNISKEKRFHKRLKAAGLHARGEWFQDGKEMLKILWEIREYDSYRKTLEAPTQAGQSSPIDNRERTFKHRLSACIALSRPKRDTDALLVG